MHVCWAIAPKYVMSDCAPPLTLGGDTLTKLRPARNTMGGPGNTSTMRPFGLMNACIHVHVWRQSHQNIRIEMKMGTKLTGNVHQNQQLLLEFDDLPHVRPYTLLVDAGLTAWSQKPPSDVIIPSNTVKQPCLPIHRHARALVLQKILS